MISTDALQVEFLSSLTKGSSLTIVNEGSPLTIVNETRNFIKTIVLKNDRFKNVVLKTTSLKNELFKKNDRF